MKTIYIVGFIIFAVIAYSIYDLYNLGCLYSSDCDVDNETVPVLHADSQTKNSNISEEKSARKEQKLSTVDLYSETQQISNQGFINELIFTHPTYSDELQNASNNTTQDIPLMPLNPPMSCNTSSDLPIANINVKYMLGKNTTMLRDT